MRVTDPALLSRAKELHMIEKRAALREPAKAKAKVRRRHKNKAAKASRRKNR